MIVNLKLLASKEIQILQKYISPGSSRKYLNDTTPSIECGRTMVERIARAKRRHSEPLRRQRNKFNSSTDFVQCQPATLKEIQKVCATRIGKRLIYRFFNQCKIQYFPLTCLLDVGSTSFVISPEAAKAFSIPVIKRTKIVKSNYVFRTEFKTEVLFSQPVAIFCGNHYYCEEEDHDFEVRTTSGDYDPLIPTSYLEKHKARGITPSHLHLPHCQPEWYGHRKSHPQ